MTIDLNLLSNAREFVKGFVLPNANEFAIKGVITPLIFKELAKNRLLGTLVNSDYGGLEVDYSTYGLITKELGYGCSSIRSLLTVHDMVCYAIESFGTSNQKQEWLPKLSSGSIIAAFALTELGVGSSIDKISTIIEEKVGGFYLYGEKSWISFGQIADLFLVFAKLNDKPVAVLIPSKSKNVTIKPIVNSLGMSASMLAELKFDGVLIDDSNILGSKNLSLNLIANQCLTLGRYSVAYGCCGIIKACLDACKQKVQERRKGGDRLIDYQLISGIITDMIADYKTSSLLCKNSGEKLQSNFNLALEDVMVAKYVCAKQSYQVASNAMQVFGAEGHSQSSSLRRWLHDAKACELIEGSNEIMRATIGKIFVNADHE